MKLFMTFFNSFLISVLLAPYFIKGLKAMQFGQSIREEGPEAHLKKSGTPTLGGLLFLFTLTVSTLSFIELKPEILLLLFITLGNGAIGFFDDFIKIALKRNLGLTSKQKLIAQIAISLIFLFFLQMQGLDTSIHIPGTDTTIELSWFYYVLVLFLVVGTTNATNLTDGVDGLLATTGIIALGAFGVAAYMVGNTDIVMFVLAFIGGLFGFLLFNRNPAKFFMGDTGSLAIGGALVGMAIILKMEILLAIIGGVFVIETLSVIMQVSSFKLRKKRLFKMSPLHHHYELSGFSETQVVKGFGIAGFAFACIALYLI